MGNCLITQLKGVAQNDNLPVFGFTKLIVDTTGQSGNTPLACLSPNGIIYPVGAYIVGEGTFTNGKRVVESTSDMALVAPNMVLTVMVPKYQHPIRVGGGDAVGSRTPFAMDLDDYEYQDRTQVQSSSDYNNGIIIGNTPSNYTTKGNLDNILWQYSPEVLRGIQLYNLSDVELNISTSPYLYKFKKTTIFRLANCGKIEGDVELFISRLMQQSKDYFKSRNDVLAIFSDHTKITYGSVLSQLTQVSPKYLKLYFNESAIVDIQSTNDDVTYVSVATYNIDTDTFALV